VYAFEFKIFLECVYKQVDTKKTYPRPGGDRRSVGINVCKHEHMVVDIGKDIFTC
jgi:hypothetical protein